MMRAGVIAAMALGAAGCEQLLGLPDPAVATDAGVGGGSCADGDLANTRQLVIDSLDAPSTAAESNAVAFDVDGDGARDNAIFAALGALVAFNPAFDVQPTVDQSLASGHLLQLMSATLGDGCANTQLFEGEDRDLPVNPADNFSGDESFRVVGNRRGRLPGTRTGDDVRSSPGGQAELRLPLFRGAAPIELPLIEAQVRYRITATGAVEGAIGGAIRSDVIEGLVIPSFASSLQTVVARDCTGGFPECCPPTSDGQAMLEVFDGDQDCAIEPSEVRDMQLVRTLFSPDVDLYDGVTLAPGAGDGIADAVSIGVAFTAVNAFFLEPVTVGN